MSRRTTLLAVALLVSVGAFVVALRARALAQVQDDVAREVVALDRTSADLDELTELRRERAVVAESRRPTQDLIAQVNAALRNAGVATDRMKSLDPEADTPLAGRYRSQTLRVTLERLSLREVGAFLASWRAAKTVWTPRSLELAHVAGSDGKSPSDRYDARVVIAATYLSDTAPESSR
jgi:hypothetical protein